jgi:hypothetical protein
MIRCTLRLSARRHAFRAVKHHRPDVGFLQLVGAQHFQRGGVDLLRREWDLHAQDLGRVEQAPGVLFHAEYGGALGRGIGADTLEAADAVVQRIGQDVGGGVPPGDQFTVVPDEAVTVGHRRHR